MAPQAPLRVLAFEPWYEGSHRAFLDSWRRRSMHAVEVLGLPGRHWKWHSRVAPWELARRAAAQALPRPDVLFASDYLDVAATVGFLPYAWRDLPWIQYFHENQLVYPERDAQCESERDLAWAFQNLFSALAADRLVFNSRFQRDELARAADELLARMPEPRPRAALARALARADVIGPGIELDAIPLGPGAPRGAPLRVLFNQRHEHDKDPVAALDALLRAAADGAELELVLLGQRFRKAPEGLAQRVAALGPRVVRDGFETSREEYARRLGACDLVLSTARHEFFGMAVLEAMAAGCAPLVPDRLAYPEVLPRELHEAALWSGEDDLVRRLREHARDPGRLRAGKARARMRSAAAEHAAEHSARLLDALCVEISGRID